MKLTGKTAIVTGAGSGIGRAIALAYAGEGAAVAVVDVDAAGAEDTLGEIRSRGGRGMVHTADISEAGPVEEMVRTVVAAFGGLHILVNNAALGQDARPVTELPVEVWDRLMAVNARGAFLCARAAIPHLLTAGGGAIINLASDLGYLGVPRLAAYCASKGALLQLTRVLAAELATSGIRVNAICPTMIDTPMARRAIASQPDPDGWMREVERSIPMGRIGRPEEVARVAVFLASEDASYMTGAAVAVDGGRSAI